MTQNQFELSVNRVHKTMFGHRNGCSQARKHGGGITGVQEHVESFESSEDAELAAAETLARKSDYTFDWCSFCCEDLNSLGQLSKKPI